MCTADAGVMFATQMGKSYIQNKEISRAGQVNYANQAAAHKADVGAIALRSEQQLESTQQNVGERALEAKRELGRINAVLSDTNMTGGSVDRLRKEVAFNAGKDITTMQVNAGNALKQARAEIKATGIKYKNAGDQIKKPSVAGTALDLFGTYLENKKDGATFGDLFKSASKPEAEYDPRAGIRGQGGY